MCIYIYTYIVSHRYLSHSQCYLVATRPPLACMGRILRGPLLLRAVTPLTRLSAAITPRQAAAGILSVLLGTRRLSFLAKLAALRQPVVSRFDTVAPAHSMCRIPGRARSTELSGLALGVGQGLMQGPMEAWLRRMRLSWLIWRCLSRCIVP